MKKVSTPHKEWEGTFWYLYMIRTDCPGKPYIGITPKPARRLQEHLESRFSDAKVRWRIRDRMRVLVCFDDYQVARAAEKEAHCRLGYGS